MNFFNKDTKTALEAKGLAQFIAFGPVVFQVTRVVRDNGILAFIEENGSDGVTIEQIITHTRLQEGCAAWKFARHSGTASVFIPRCKIGDYPDRPMRSG